jgi:hypothetical protein
MTAALLFAASFVVVLALGLQQINVERRSILAAALTSPLIGLATFVQIKLIPGPTGVLDVLGFLLGGSAGIVSAIALHPHLLRLAGRWVPRTVEWVPPEPAAPAPAPNDRAEHLGETIRLAMAIADDAARCEIEVYCHARAMAGSYTWWDTLAPTTDEPIVAQDIARALAYLQRREIVVRHPVQAHLVRFEHDSKPRAIP